MVLTIHESNGTIEVGEEDTLRVGLEGGRVRHNDNRNGDALTILNLRAYRGN